MAALTWKNVDAPSSAGANDALRLAILSQQSAFDNIGKALSEFQDSKSTTQSNQLLERLNTYNDPVALEKARADGSLFQGIDPRYINADAMKTVGSRVNDLLGNVQARATIAGTEASTGFTQAQTQGQNLENQGRAFTLEEKKAQAAAIPEAAKVIADIRTKYLSGSPTAADEAAAMTNANSALLARAGYDIPSIMSGNFDAMRAGAGNQVDQTKLEDFWTNRVNVKTGKELADAAIQDFPQNSEGAIEAIRNHPNASPEVKIAAMQSYQDRAPALEAPTDPVAAAAGIQSPFINNGQAEAIVYKNQGATRNQPLAPELYNPLNTIANSLGVRVEVFSGGQPSSGPNRVGSHRHDNGNAADVNLFIGNRQLDPNKPEDLPYFEAFYNRARDAGIGGIGQSKDYMGGKSLHIGYGPEGVWGEGGQGANAAPWLKQARAAYEKKNPNAKSFDGSLMSDDIGEAPVGFNISDKSLSNPTEDPEQVYTAKIGDYFVNIPTIINGNKVTPAEAIQAYADDQNPAVGKFKSAQEAKDAALKRVQDIREQQDKILAGPKPANDPNAPATTPNLYPGLVADNIAKGKTAPTTAITPTGNPDLNIPIAGMTLDNEAKVDSVFGSNEDLKQAIINRPNLGASPAAVIKSLKANNLSNYDEAVLTQVMDETRQKYPGIAPDIVGALIERNIESRVMPNKTLLGVPVPFTSGGGSDKFGGASTGSTAPRINMDGIDKDIQLLATKNDKTGQWNLKPGISMLNTDNLQKSYKQQLSKIQSANALNESRHQSFLASQANVPDTPAKAKELAKREDQYQYYKMYFSQQLEMLNKTGIGTSNTVKPEDK